MTDLGSSWGQLAGNQSQNTPAPAFQQTIPSSYLNQPASNYNISTDYTRQLARQRAAAQIAAQHAADVARAQARDRAIVAVSNATDRINRGIKGVVASNPFTAPLYSGYKYATDRNFRGAVNRNVSNAANTVSHYVGAPGRYFGQQKKAFDAANQLNDQQSTAVYELNIGKHNAEKAFEQSVQDVRSGKKSIEEHNAYVDQLNTQEDNRLANWNQHFAQLAQTANTEPHGGFANFFNWQDKYVAPITAKLFQGAQAVAGAPQRALFAVAEKYLVDHSIDTPNQQQPYKNSWGNAWKMAGENLKGNSFGFNLATDPLTWSGVGGGLRRLERGLTGVASTGVFDSVFSRQGAKTVFGKLPTKAQTLLRDQFAWQKGTPVDRFGKWLGQEAVPKSTRIFQQTHDQVQALEKQRTDLAGKMKNFSAGVQGQAARKWGSLSDQENKDVQRLLNSPQYFYHGVIPDGVQMTPKLDKFVTSHVDQMKRLFLREESVGSKTQYRHGYFSLPGGKYKNPGDPGADFTFPFQRRRAEQRPSEIFSNQDLAKAESDRILWHHAFISRAETSPRRGIGLARSFPEKDPGRNSPDYAGWQMRKRAWAKDQPPAFRPTDWAHNSLPAAYMNPKFLHPVEKWSRQFQALGRQAEQVKTEGLAAGDKRFHSAPERFRRALGAPTRAWKSTVLGLSPTWYENNAGWNTLVNLQESPMALGRSLRYLSRTPDGLQVSTGKLGKALEKFSPHTRGKDPLVGAKVEQKGFKQYGGFADPKLESKPLHLIPPSKRWGRVPEDVTDLNMFSQDKGGAINKIMAPGSHIENSFRAGLYDTKRAQGLTHEQALSHVNKELFSYHVKNWERPLKSLIPFWSWQKNITKYAYTMPFRHPLGTKFYQGVNKQFITDPQAKLEAALNENNQPDPATGKVVHQNVPAWLKNKVYLGGDIRKKSDWRSAQFLPLSPGAWDNSTNFNPLLQVLHGIFTSKNKFGESTIGQNPSDVFRDIFPQGRVITTGLKALGGKFPEQQSYSGITGNTKVKQGFDRNAGNYDPSLDTIKNFTDALSTFTGTRKLTIDIPKINELMRFQYFMKEYPNIGHTRPPIGTAPKDKEAAYNKIQQQREDLAHKYGFDLQKDIYDKWFSKNDDPFTAIQKRLQAETRNFSSQVYADFKKLLDSPDSKDKGRKINEYIRHYHELEAQGAIFKQYHGLDLFPNSNKPNQNVWGGAGGSGGGVFRNGKWFKTQQSADRYAKFVASGSGRGGTPSARSAFFRSYYNTPDPNARFDMLAAHPEFRRPLDLNTSKGKIAWAYSHLAPQDRKDWLSAHGVAPAQHSPAEWTAIRATNAGKQAMRLASDIRRFPVIAQDKARIASGIAKTVPDTVPKSQKPVAFGVTRPVRRLTFGKT